MVAKDFIGSNRTDMISIWLELNRFDFYSVQPNRNLIVSVLTETIRFSFGKWWILKSNCNAVLCYAMHDTNG